MSNQAEQFNNRPTDFKAAYDLVAEDPILKDDLYTKEFIDNGCVTKDGVEMDLGDFMADRKEFLLKKENLDLEKLEANKAVSSEDWRTGESQK